MTVSAGTLGNNQINVTASYDGGYGGDGDSSGMDGFGSVGCDTYITAVFDGEGGAGGFIRIEVGSITFEENKGVTS